MTTVHLSSRCNAAVTHNFSHYQTAVLRWTPETQGDVKTMFPAEFGKLHTSVKHADQRKLADRKTRTKPLKPPYIHTNTINTKYTYNYTMWNI